MLWLYEHLSVCKSNVPPFSYVDEKTGNIEGVEKSILDRISEISGLSFSYETLATTDDLQKFASEQGIVVAAGVENYTESKLHRSSFTKNYMNISKYFVGLAKKPFDTTAKNVVAMVNALDSQIEYMEKLYPNIEFENYQSTEECIKSLRNGEIDYFLGNPYALDNILSSPRYEDLKLFPIEAISTKICFQLFLDDENKAILTSILNKSITLLSDNEKDQFLNEYVQKNKYKYSIFDFIYQYRLQIFFAGLVLLISCIALFLLYKTKKKARLEIEENEMKLRNITNNINGGVIVLMENEGLKITFANDGFLDLIGCSRKEFDEKGNGSYLAYVHPDDLQILKDAIDSKRKELSLELRVLKNDGTYVPALFNCTSAKKNNGIVEHYCVILDMTEQNNLLEQLRVDKRRTDLILERVDEIFYEIDLRDKTITTSLSFYQKMGWKLPDRIPEDENEDKFENMWHTDTGNLKKMRLATDEMMEKKETVSTIMQMWCEQEKRYVWYEIIQHPILSESDSIVTIIGLIRNVDEQILERERLLEQAQRDPLTGLYNKETFEKIVTDTLQKMPTQNHALIFIDLDHFKNLNDTLGHMVGDKAICEAADKLKIIFSNFDVLSRFGGDEFCIFVKNIPYDTLKGKMDWLIDRMHHEYSGEKGVIHITCSSGIACTQQAGYDYQTLMKHADQALYYSKEHGRDRYTFYNDDLS